MESVNIKSLLVEKNIEQVQYTTTDVLREYGQNALFLRGEKLNIYLDLKLKQIENRRINRVKYLAFQSERSIMCDYLSMESRGKRPTRGQKGVFESDKLAIGGSTPKERLKLIDKFMLSLQAERAAINDKYRSDYNKMLMTKSNDQFSDHVVTLDNGDEFDFKNPKTFLLVGTINNGLISRWIQKNSKTDLIRVGARWSHVCVMGLDTDGQIKVWESHFDGGVVKKPFDTWVKKNANKKEIKGFLYPGIELNKLNHWASQNLPYGTLDILGLLSDSKLGFGNIRNSEGLICSEYVAMCDSGNVLKFANKDRPDEIKPVDFQLFQKAHNLSLLDLMKVKRKKISK